VSVMTGELSNMETQVTRRQVIAAAAASMLGFGLDLFDLFLLLYVASTIAPLFFPTKIPTLSLASVYASFAISLFFRPLGSAIFGNYADKHGRKKALIVTLMGLGISTALLGALPTFPQVGIVASILFILIRIVQGIFVGGVTASSHTIGTETVAPKWRGLMSGLVSGSGAGLGGLVASLVFFICASIFKGDAFGVWGWRCVFFSGFITVIVGLILERSLEESPIWLMKQKQKELQKQKGETVEVKPLATLFSRTYGLIMLINIIVAAGAASQYYLTSGFLPTFLGVINQIPKDVSGKIMVIGNLFILIAAPLVGHISEMIGRRRTFLLFGVINLILLPLGYWGLWKAGTALGVVIAYVILLSFFGNTGYAPVIIFLNERFPTEIRASGTSLCWNLGFAIGGTMPTFVTLASKQMSDIPASVIGFVIGVTLLLLFGALLSPETKGRFE